MSKCPHPFTTIDEQISILKARHLDFRSEDQARNLLSMYGYYNIINGYKDNYVNKNENDEEYREGVSFEQIYSLFTIDHSLRNKVMQIMIDIEEMLRATSAYVIGENIGYLHNDYLDINKYRNISKSNPKFSLRNIMDRLNDTYNSDKNPIKYNRQTYHNVPPWVLLKGVYFSTIVNYIGFFKGPMKTELISMVYNIEPSIIDDEIKNLFMNSLYMFLDYRNLCAHGGRIYNFNPKSSLQITPHSFKTKNFSNVLPMLNSSYNIGRLILSLNLFASRSYSDLIIADLSQTIKQHCLSYPDDYDYLLDSMGIRNIVTIKLDTK